jgi:glycosyltransferase involved in cell wall biosynthesis
MLQPANEALLRARAPAAAIPRISVIIPVFDEAEAIGPVLDELIPILENLPGGYEVIAVDDGSTDRTLEILARRRAANSALRVLSLSPHSGQSAAFEAGFRHARGSVLVTLDGDGQNVPSDIPRVVDALDGYDAVFGVRAERSDPPVRKLAQRVANLVRNGVLGSRYRDVGCSLKAFRREIVAGVTLYDGLHRFFPYLVEMRGGRGIEIEVAHRRRERGKSKYRPLGRWRETLADLWMVRRMMRRSRRFEVSESR